MLLLFILLSRSWVKLSLSLVYSFFAFSQLLFVFSSYWFFILLIFHRTHLSLTVTHSASKLKEEGRREKKNSISLVDWNSRQKAVCYNTFATYVSHTLNETKNIPNLKLISPSSVLQSKLFWHKRSLSPMRFWSPIFPKRKHIIFCNGETLTRIV